MDKPQQPSPEWTLQQCEEISDARKELRNKAMLWASGGAALGFAGGLSMSNVLFPQRPMGTLHVPTKAHAATESAAVHSRLIKSIGGLWKIPLVRIRGRPLKVRRHAVVTGACMLLGLAVGASAGVPASDRAWLNAHPQPTPQQLRAALVRSAAAREYTVIGASRAAAVKQPSTSAQAHSSESMHGSEASTNAAPAQIPEVPGAPLAEGPGPQMQSAEHAAMDDAATPQHGSARE